MGEFTLTDDVRHGEGRLSPSVFLCLAQLQSSRTPLFPNLRRLRIVNAHYSLDYLRLFLSPSLETLEIVGLDETCRSTLLSFLSAAVVEVPNLNTLILGPGRLSRDVVDACLSFSRLKRLELVDFISSADYQLLMDVGRLEHLETFVIGAQGIAYAPMPAILKAEREERARSAAEECRRRQIEDEEHRRQKCEEEECRRRKFEEEECCRRKLEAEEQERQRRFEEEVEERQRKAALPRRAGVCWMCRKRFIDEEKTQCKSCSKKILRQDQKIQELKDERRRHEEQRTLEIDCSAKGVKDPRASSTEYAWDSRQSEFSVQGSEDADEMEEDKVTGYGGIEEPEDLPVQKMDVSNGLRVSNLRKTSGSDACVSGAHASGGPLDGQPCRIFTKLLEVTICSGAEMMQDLVELIDSASVTLISLEMVPVQPSPSSSIASSPSRQFVATIDSALRRWAGTIAHVTLSGPPGIGSKLPDETVGALVRLPQLERLELSGWDVTPDISDCFCRPGNTNTSKLKVLHLPNDNNAISMPLSKLGSIAEACPNLLSLRCRLGNLLDIPNRDHSLFSSKPLSHSLETLTIGDANSPLDFEAILEVAQYIDNLFPKIEEIKPLEVGVHNSL